MQYHSKAVKTATFKGSLNEFQRCKDFKHVTSPQLYGKRAVAWLGIWDRGGTPVRLNLLEALISLHGQSNASMLMDDMGDAMPLFLTRVVSWLRLCYLQLPPAGRYRAGSSTRTPLLALVEALTIFSRGVSCLSQIAESGIVAALVDCLKRGGEKGAFPPSDANGSVGFSGGPSPFVPVRTRERKAIMLLLLYIANAGRVYRELIADGDGVADLLVVLQREGNAEVAALLTELFITLGNGVPRLGLQVQCGLLRLILAERALEGRLAAAKAAESANNNNISNSDGNGITTTTIVPSGQSVFVLTSESFRESILQAARALRGLQLSYESRYFGSFQEQGLLFAAAADPPVASGEWDHVPVICLGGNHAFYSTEASQPQWLGGAAAAAAAAVSDSPSPQSRQDTEESSFLRPVNLTELLEGLFFLAKHECSSRYRVEGSELLTLVAKNINLTQPILNHCFDVLSDDQLSITDDDADFSLIRQQRRQLYCGRTAVQVILSKPMTTQRHALIMKLVAIRGSHVLLLKYLRITDQSDTAAVIDCCMALQMVACASNAAQHAHMLEPSWLMETHNDDEIDEKDAAEAHEESVVAHYTPRGDIYGNALMRIGHAIRDALGDSLYQVVLYQKLTEEECFAMQRASRDAVFVVK